MFCAQDSLAEEDSGGEPAALTAVSQYACKRRTTIDNYNKIFTVSVNNKNIKKREIKKKKSIFFPHQCSFAHLRQLIFSNIFFCQILFCSNLECGGNIILQTAPRSPWHLSQATMDVSFCHLLAGAGARHEARRSEAHGLHTQDEEVAASLDEHEIKWGTKRRGLCCI